MVIGQKTIQKINNSVNYNNSSSLVIHINENWVVFCLFNKTKLIDLNKVNFLHEKKSTFILKTTKKYLKSFSKKNTPNKVKLIYYNKSSALVPHDLFDDKNSLNYLKYNARIQINDLAANDLILEDQINNVYIPHTDINNYIFEKFKAFDFYHYSSVLIEKLSNELTDNFSQNVFLNINNSFIDILYFKNKQLIFFNSFDYNSNEDILYYLLFTFSELSLNPDKIHLVCCGPIDLDSELYALLYNYIRNIELLKFQEIEGIESNILKSNILLCSFQ
jgi:hypothetical protein